MIKVSMSINRIVWSVVAGLLWVLFSYFVLLIAGFAGQDGILINILGLPAILAIISDSLVGSLLSKPGILSINTLPGFILSVLYGSISVYLIATIIIRIRKPSTTQMSS